LGIDLVAFPQFLDFISPNVQPKWWWNERKDPKDHLITYMDVPSTDEYSLKVEELGDRF
jgi:hypothetical protein